MAAQLTIITATYNSALHIKKCLKSVEHVLGDQDFEHIIIDGYSTDKTYEYINSYAEIHDNVCIHYRNPNGIYDALNYGIELCKTEYVMFLHSDDVLLEGFKLLYKSGFKSDVYFFGINLQYKKYLYRKYRATPQRSKYASAIYPPPHTGMISKTHFLKKYKFDLGYDIASDYKQLLCLLSCQKIRKTFRNDCIVCMSAGGESTKIRNSKKILLEEHRILTDLGLYFPKVIISLKKICKIFNFRSGNPYK